MFTVITIIFLPLSFVVCHPYTGDRWRKLTTKKTKQKASFFGMNIKEISGSDNEYGIGYFWMCAGTSCIIVVLVALLVAFNRWAREMIAGTWDKVAKQVTSTRRGIGTTVSDGVKVVKGAGEMKGMRRKGGRSADGEHIA